MLDTGNVLKHRFREDKEAMADAASAARSLTYSASDDIILEFWKYATC